MTKSNEIRGVPRDRVEKFLRDLITNLRILRDAVVTADSGVAPCNLDPTVAAIQDCLDYDVYTLRLVALQEVIGQLQIDAEGVSK